jgi:hypothetical protein
MLLPPGRLFGHNPHENSMSTYLSKKYAKTGRENKVARAAKILLFHTTLPLAANPYLAAWQAAAWFFANLSLTAAGAFH